MRVRCEQKKLFDEGQKEQKDFFLETKGILLCGSEQIDFFFGIPWEKNNDIVDHQLSGKLNRCFCVHMQEHCYFHVIDMCRKSKKSV